MIELLNANALSIPLADGSVQMVATSPPYYGLRDYNTGRWEGGDPECDHVQTKRANLESGLRNDGRKHKGLYEGEKATEIAIAYKDICGKCGALRIDDQLGLEPTPEDYVANLVAVFRELRRVLRDDGVAFLNLGDSYNGSGGPGSQYDNKAKNSYKGEFKKYDNPNRNISTLKPKDLIGIPWRVAFALQADGWWLRSDIIWAKPNPMPESVTDRPTKAHEYVFILSKSAHYYWDQEAVKEEASTPLNSTARQSFGGPKLDDTIKSHASNHGKAYRDERSGTRNIRSVWNVATKPSGVLAKTGHYRRVSVGEVSDGMICIPSPSCRAHEGLAAQAAREFYGEPEDDLLDRIESIYNRLFQVPFCDCVPTDQQLALGCFPNSSGYSPREYSPSAIDHNNETHRMALALDSSPAYIPFFEILSRIADKRELLVSFVQHLCIYGNSTVEDDFYEHLLQRIPHRIVDKSFVQALMAYDPPVCECQYYQYYTRNSDHFAMFPPKLVEPMIKAGSSEKGCCPVCGKPWVRVVERISTGKRYSTGKSLSKNIEGLVTAFSGYDDGSSAPSFKTTGWRPACDHDAEPVPCVVLDPFVGSGTTLLVARQLGRSAIGLDLSFTYLKENATKRLELDKLKRWIGC